MNRDVIDRPYFLKIEILDFNFQEKWNECPDVCRGNMMLKSTPAMGVFHAGSATP